MPMTAEIVSVGTELLLGQIVDTHAATMGRILAECGIACQRRQTVGDNLERIIAVIEEALQRADMVVTIGGLGPTQDDLTREAIAAALGDEIVYEPAIEEEIRKSFAQRGIAWTDSQKRQAFKPRSARLVDNPNGTAPGLICEKNGKSVVALPGPRGEFTPMAEGPIREFLESKSGGEVILSRTLRICGMGESQVEQKLGQIMRGENPTVAPYAHPGEVHLRLTARGVDRADAEGLIEPVARKIEAILGDAIYGFDDTTLEASVIEMLCERRLTVGTAESLTGGGLVERLTGVPGSSDTVLGAVVAYSADVKQNLLGVSKETLEMHGPVSAQTAREMAEGARKLLKVDCAVSLTGNAGPSVDKDNKPVGLVYVSVATPKKTEVEEHRFRGTREDIRRRSEQAALVLLRKNLLEPGNTNMSDPSRSQLDSN